MKKIKLIEVNSEIGAGTRGASLGVEAMKMASLNSGSDFFSKYPSLLVENENQILFEDADQSVAKNIRSLTKVIERLMEAINDTLENKAFPIILAGDHSSATGTIAGIKSTYPHQRLGVIWIDAHADLHSPFTSPSGNIHGMPLSIALGVDNLEHKKNNVPEDIIQNWDKLKTISKVSPMISCDDLVLIGVRDTEKEENYLIDQHHIKKITVDEVRIYGFEKIVNDINEYLKNCDLIYVSFDVDSMDCHLVSHGTGTPVPGGFSEEEATQILLHLLKNEKICCFEITEINPLLDEKRNLMAETAFRILKKAAKEILN